MIYPQTKLGFCRFPFWKMRRHTVIIQSENGEKSSKPVNNWFIRFSERFTCRSFGLTMREMKGIYIYYILCVYIYTHYMIYMYINSYDFMVLPTVRSIFSNSASCGPRAELPKHQQRQEGRPSDF